MLEQTYTENQLVLHCSIIVIVIVISKLLKRYTKLSAPGHQLIHERYDESKGGFQRGVERSSGPISRVPGRDRVAVRVGVVEMGRGMIRRVRVGVIEEMRFQF